MPLPAADDDIAACVVLVGPTSAVSERIATALRRRHVDPLRTACFDASTQFALPFGARTIIIVVADRRDSSIFHFDLAASTPEARTLRIIKGRLMSASSPSSNTAWIVDVLAEAGVALSARMREALTVPETSGKAESATCLKLHYTT